MKAWTQLNLSLQEKLEDHLFYPNWGKENFGRKSINEEIINNEIYMNMNRSIPEAINNRNFFTR